MQKHGVLRDRVEVMYIVPNTSQISIICKSYSRLKQTPSWQAYKLIALYSSIVNMPIPKTYVYPPIECRPPRMKSASVFRLHRFQRRVLAKTKKVRRGCAFHQYISEKSGVRKDLVTAVMNALPMAVFRELNTYGDCKIKGFLNFTEKINPCRSMDIDITTDGEFDKAANQNWS